MKKGVGHFLRLASCLAAAFIRAPFAAAIQLKNIPTYLAAFNFARATPWGPPSPTLPVAPVPDPSDNPLRAYFENHREGPGIWKWDHYFEIYHRHLAKFIGREAHLVEVGIYSGGSLQMWRSYFGPKMHVHGIDIEPVCEVYRGDGVSIHIGDQSDQSFWTEFRRKVPQVDILIDDGGHLTEQQCVTIEEILPHLRPGGVYICEDIHGRYNQFSSYLSGYCSALNEGFEDGKPGLAINEFQKWIHSIHFYPCIVVIEKRDIEQSRLMNSKRGTQWQPFFDKTAD